jgi:replicative DNA helicase
MADVQHACLTKIVSEGDLVPFIEARITKDFFPDPRHGQVWDMVIEHYQKYGKPPEPTSINKAYPDYKFPVFPEPTAYYLHQLRQDRLKVILVSTVQDVATRLNADEEGPDIGTELETILRDGLAQAMHEITQGRDSDFYPSHKQIFDRLEAREADPDKLKGISCGMHSIDMLTGGLQPEQLITMIGTPKAGKSSVLLKMAFEAHRNGNRVLFVTFEMSTEEQQDRVVSLLAGVGLTKILRGEFDHLEKERIRKALDIRKRMEGFWISSDITSATTVSGIQAKIKQYQPALVVIDGVYLMDDETGHDKGSPQALTAITRGFKRLAQTNRIPVVISTQAMLYRAKSGLHMGSIGYSSSFAQDSDIIFGVEADEHLMGVSHFKVVAARSSPLGEALLRFDWGKGIIEEIDHAAYQQALVMATPTSSSGKTKGQSALLATWGDEDEEEADAAEVA